MLARLVFPNAEAMPVNAFFNSFVHHLQPQLPGKI